MPVVRTSAESPAPERIPAPTVTPATIGVAGSSPLGNRKLDTFGVCYYYLGLTDGFKNMAPVLLPLRDEQGIELFYNAAVTPWCHLTPDLQFILPSRSRNDAVTALGMRAKIDF